MRVDATSYADATDRILSWAGAHESRYVTVATVNNVMESFDDRSFRRDHECVRPGNPRRCPAGLGASGVRGQAGDARVRSRPYAASYFGRRNGRVSPSGSTAARRRFSTSSCSASARRFPDLRIVFGLAPPFRTLTAEEDERITRDIEASGARIVFVGLGCPKQERWMSEHRPSVRAVMLGVGAAFDFLAGSKRQAPAVLQRMGLEWLFRLATEPRRLWRRYLRHNPRFVVLFGRQVLRTKLHRALGSADEEGGNDRV